MTTKPYPRCSVCGDELPTGCRGRHAASEDCIWFLGARVKELEAAEANRQANIDQLVSEVTTDYPMAAEWRDKFLAAEARVAELTKQHEADEAKIKRLQKAIRDVRNQLWHYLRAAARDEEVFVTTTERLCESEGE